VDPGFGRSDDFAPNSGIFGFKMDAPRIVSFKGVSVVCLRFFFGKIRSGVYNVIGWG